MPASHVTNEGLFVGLGFPDPKKLFHVILVFDVEPASWGFWILPRYRVIVSLHIFCSNESQVSAQGFQLKFLAPASDEAAWNAITSNQWRFNV